MPCAFSLEVMTREEARATLLTAEQPPEIILRALRREVKLNDLTIGGMVRESASTVRRWRRTQDGIVPDRAATAIDDLRLIVAMLLRAGYSGRTVKSFLLSRNTGLGKDRPLDALRPEIGARRQVEHVTECFVVGIAPEPQPPLLPRRPACAVKHHLSGSSHSDLRIRRAWRDDALVLNGLAQRAYAPYVPRIGRRPAPMDDDYIKRIARGNAFVAETTSRVVGLIVMIRRADYLLVENVAVDPDHQREGIGRALLAFAETTARDAGIPTLRLYTNAEMTENLLFYSRLGFEETDRRISKGFERIFFSRRILSR
jgi:ribosomal protein S18 acetylase RimI-like enzyme